MNGWNYVNQNPINLIDPSGKIPNCGPEKPCKVIVGSKELGDQGQGGHWYIPRRHAFILVADPNRQWYPDLDHPTPGLIPGIPPVFNPQADPSNQLPYMINRSSTVYFFRAGPVGGNLFAKYGYYTKGATLDYLPLSVKYATIVDDVRCSYILRCFKRVMKHINALEIRYIPTFRNSNTTISTALRRCGLPAANPFSDIINPQWDEDIDNDKFWWNFWNYENSANPSSYEKIEGSHYPSPPYPPLPPPSY